MIDDIHNLSIPKSAKKYARMKGPKGTNAKHKVDLFTRMSKDIANKNRPNTFKNSDEGGKVKHAFKENAAIIVDKLLS